MSTLYKKQLGMQGERLAEVVLRNKNYSIKHKNWRYQRCGEIDLVVTTNTPSVLVFVEVKTRVGQQNGLPSESIGLKKQAQMIKMAECYLTLFPLQEQTQVRFDVISVYYENAQSEPLIRHYENAFDVD